MAVTNFLAVLIGALVGSGATYFANLRIEKVKARNTDDAEATNLTILLKLEFNACEKSLGELKSSLEAQNFYLLKWTNILRQTVVEISSLRTSFYKLRDVDLQERLFSLITDLLIFLNDVDGLETWQLGLQRNPPVDPNGTLLSPTDVSAQVDLLKDQRRLKLVDLVDLKRRAQEAVKDLSPKPKQPTEV